MVTTPAEVEAPPTRVERTKTAARSAATGAAKLGRSALTGDPAGRIRRTILFVIAAASIGVTNLGITGVIGLIAILLLALTDNTDA